LGRVTIKIKGASTLKAYIKMLLTFGEFSGVGIKTSMGIGGLEIEKRKT
jgi:CRISPR/Cas system endoribonuclease Cas6 (RAMP superfamily)